MCYLCLTYIFGENVFFLLQWFPKLVGFFPPFLYAVAFDKSQKTGMCCHDDWDIRWPVGCDQLQQQGEVYLQEAGRGCPNVHSSTNHPSSELCIWMDTRYQKKCLLQSMRIKSLVNLSLFLKPLNFIFLSFKDLQTNERTQKDLAGSAGLLQGHGWRPDEHTQYAGPCKFTVC